jgi:predicted dehydrogenase
MKEIEATRVAIIGCGSMARFHLRVMLEASDGTEIPVVCEPSSKEYAAVVQEFVKAGRPAPPNEPYLTKLLADYAKELDAVFIITPHHLHCEQTVACLEAGLDVLLEKPMAMNAEEARRLIEVRDRTGNLLVVAFNGGLSPEIRTAESMLRSGELGLIRSISATIWQDWRDLAAGSWRQMPDLAGGGFMFDTGAHMLNTVADLAGEEFVEVAAWMDNRETPVDILGVVMGKLASGALVTLHGCGDTVPSCASEIRVFCSEAILRTGAWGKFLEIQTQGSQDFEPVEVPVSTGAWEQFLAVRRGELPNPCPPEVGLRMAILWDAIRESAANNGMPVMCKNLSRS